MKSKRAEVSYTMQVLIQIVLISFVTVSLLGYVGQLKDNTVFQKQVLVKEAALTTMAALAAPASAYSRIIHRNIPMEKFTFLLEDNKIKVGVNQQFIHQYYGGDECTGECNAKGAFIVLKQNTFGLTQQIPGLKLQTCPKVKASTKAVQIDAGAAMGVNQELVKKFVQNFIANPPTSFLGEKTKPRSVDELFKEFDERRNIGYDDRLLVSLQFEKNIEPKILIDIMSAQNDDQGDYRQKVTESRALACNVANEMGGDIPIVAVHPYWLPPEHPALMLRQKNIAIQIVLPENYNTQHLDQKIWRGVNKFVY